MRVYLKILVVAIWLLLIFIIVPTITEFASAANSIQNYIGYLSFLFIALLSFYCKCGLIFFKK